MKPFHKNRTLVLENMSDEHNGFLWDRNIVFYKYNIRGFP